MRRGVTARAVAAHRAGGSDSLFGKYLIVLTALVGISLFISGALDFYFSYQDNRRVISQLQHRDAMMAASSISRFVEDLLRQIDWTAPTNVGVADIEIDERLGNFQRLLRQADAVTTITYVDANGREQLQVSRLSHTVIGALRDRSNTPEYSDVRPYKPYFGPVSFREGSEPYMTLSVADRRGSGVTIADVNLKLIAEVVRQIRVGDVGSSYLVDAQGRLIAHPDLSLVLRHTDLSNTRVVRRALESKQTMEPQLVDDFPFFGTDQQGVISTYAPIPGPGWLVFVQQPIGEAYSPLYASLVRTLGLMVAALTLAALASFALARRMTSPIKQLQFGAARIGAGALDQRIEVHTGDELEVLAEEFNRMASQLSDLYAGLENRVAERTEELAATMRELEIKSRELEVASHHKSEFLANMSHELRTPLTAVIGFSEVLLQRMFGQVNPKQEEYLKDILDSGQHLLSLINDILDLSKVEAGHLELELSTFWLPEALESSVQILRETATRRGVTLEIKIASEVGEIEADLRRVRQILFNLLSNALKFTPPDGRVTLLGRVDGGRAEIAVRDTGIGIPLDEQPRIFDAFQQANSIAAQTAEGTGLGLTLVKSLVELHGGEIWLESAPGLGSTFTFSVPLRHGASDDESEAENPVIVPATLLSQVG